MKEELDLYKKECKKCGENNLVPSGQFNCLKCLSKKLKSWETICLQCGKMANNLKGGNKFCWNCLGTNSQKFKNEFTVTLSKEQLNLFHRYEKWNDARVGAIMLD